ncbi:MAG: prepilin-type N-terminal cleavage/methylation domain-containing protein [Thiobacillus sp.]|nr:prepilin-type N-terminal cleavage/methylation domain-containing protein [Thiobacillus sp.]
MKQACRGFSLLEVLVAFIILALALGVLMRIFSGGLGNIGAAEHYSRAVAIAESKLVAAGVESPLTAGENVGEEEQGYTWRTSVQRYEAGTQPIEAALPVDLYQVEVSVTWGETATPRTLRFVTLRAAPRP